ncbi:MAG: hypothetical protein E6Q83_10730 [Thiothrix sp.]|nr:MAG: hypothetical protein E6Q83_10730 [Thiothrix sp.]
MYPKALIWVAFEVLLIMLPMQTVAAPSQPSRLLPERNTVIPVQNPSSTFLQLSKMISESSLYERVLTSPDFIKVQSIAQRWWDNQTGAKHKQRAAYSKRMPKNSID